MISFCRSRRDDGLVTDGEGNVSTDICLTNNASKGKSGRVIPIHSSLRDLLIRWRNEQAPRSDFIAATSL